MNNIIDKTKKLIDSFENSNLIRKLDYYKEIVINNSELLELINKYNTSKDDYEKISLKEKIYKYSEYKEKNYLAYNIIGTRPTMNRVKESMFASIQNYIDNSIVLDLFCGTGSLGIEALSMGASRCYFVDNNKDILRYLNKNINNLGINSKSIIVSKDYRDSLLYFKNNNIKFNIVLVDAPYKMEVMEEVIELVTKYDLLLDNGILLLEYSFDKLKDKYNNLELLKSKKYSDKYVNIYLKIID
jgi:RNA methyltransferase, rsmD family